MFNPKEKLLDQQLAESGLEQHFFMDLITGGADSRNKAAREQQRVQQENIRKNYEFEWGDPNSDELGGEALRKYDYAVEGLEITKKNTEKNLQYQEANLVQNYDYGMGIRNYEHTQNVRAYDQSVSRALKQQSFNELAEGAALVDQDRLVHEQLLSIAFDQTESLLEYGAAAAGLGLKKRQARAGAATEAQATRISALKATGAAQARGVSGRSAAMNVQGMLAEAGARQAAIIDELMFNTEGADMDFLRLNNQFMIDQVAFETSRESATMSDMAARAKIKQQALQAAINAEASIALKPEIAPPLPIPFALPRPEFQDIFKPAKPPMTTVPPAAQENLFAAGLNRAVQIASMAAGMGAFSGAGAGSGLSGIAPASQAAGVSYGGGVAAGAFSGASGLGASSFGGFGGFGGGFGIGKF